MLNFSFKQSILIRFCLLFALLTAVSGCRSLSDFFDPAKRTPKAPLKTVKRDKPNLADSSVQREVDPDSDDLIETDDDSDIVKVEQNGQGTTTNPAAPAPDLTKIEQKAKALVGRWSPADGNDRSVVEFTISEKDGETFIGTFKFFDEEGALVESARYVVSREKLITLILAAGERKIDAAVSADGNSLRLTDQNGKVSNLTRSNSQPQPNKPVQTVPQQPARTPQRPEIPDQ